jgi:hypothetical protein
MSIPFQTINWAGIEKVTYPGQTGTAWWQTLSLPGLRIRLVEYSAGYLADHWCRKGHIVHCLEGEFINELHSGEKTVMHTGSSYVVSDGLSPHRSYSEKGCRLLIVDGDFLKEII